jgi:hypothetical protein
MTMAVGNLVLDVWHIAAFGLTLLLSVLAAGHVVLYKRDSRAAIAWVGFIWLVPLVGSVLYFLFATRPPCCEGTWSGTGHKLHAPSVFRKSCSVICRIIEGISRCWLGSLDVW